MFFDDRLATVLRQTGDSEAGARTQFRQLLDILGNRKFGSTELRDHSLVAAAWLRMDDLAGRIPSDERAAIIRERGWRLRSADLTAHLADFEPDVASAALNRAELSADDWTALIPRLPVRARGFLRLRSELPEEADTLLERLGVHDRGLPSPGGFAWDHGELKTVDDDTDPARQVGKDLPPPFDLIEEYHAAEEADRDGPPSDLASEEIVTDDTEGSPATETPPGSTEAHGPPSEVSDGFDVLSDSYEYPNAAGRSEISALVERIAQFRRSRDADPADAELSPRLPLEEESVAPSRRIDSFGFSADAAGRIEWADQEVAPMVIGTSLMPSRHLEFSEHPSTLMRAFTRHQPIHNMPFALEGADALSGDWSIDAEPRFTDDGNFTGYLGRFRRPAAPDADPVSSAEQEADRIRQLLHELRTPVTAVQGYAEVIQQQLFGPAPHEYRAMAAAIAADAAHILAGFEELDRLARLETGAIDIVEGETDLADLVTRTIAQLTNVLSPRMAGIELDYVGDRSLLVALDHDEAEALIWRLLATLGGGCASGEMLACTLTSDHAMARLTCEAPAQLIGEDSIFAADAKPIANSVNAGLFGAGFALRLARAEARSAGGELVYEGEQMTMLLPLLTTDETLRSHSNDGGAHAGN